MDRIKVGVIGCGNISAIYFKMMREVYGDLLDLCACADLDMSRARAKARENPGVTAMSVRNYGRRYPPDAPFSLSERRA